MRDDSRKYASFSGFLSGKENILAAVEEIQGLSEDTNLYYGISESLKLLETGEAYDGKKKYSL